MIKILLSITLSFTFLNTSSAQVPAIQWQFSLGGTLDDNGLGCSRQPTPDGGYILCGRSNSNDGDVTGHHGTASEPDAWIVKLDTNGYIDWQHSYGGTLNDIASDVINTSDGGYIFCGITYSSDGDVTGNHSTGDVWVVKLDVNGTIQWQQSYGGPGEEFGYSIIENNNGGYIVNAYTTANGGDVTGYHGLQDMWVFKIDVTGALLWQKCLGGTNFEGSLRNSISIENDGGIVVCGSTLSTNGDVSFNHGATDMWLVKIDSLGVLLWEKTFGGTGNDVANCLTKTADGGYLIAGSTFSPVSGDVTFRYGNTQDEDLWMVKTDSATNKQWVKTLGGTGAEQAFAVSELATGGYYLLGNTSSNNFDVTNYHGFNDYWFMKIDTVGNLNWGSCFGGSDFETASNFSLANDGGILMIGKSGSNDGDVSGHHGPIGFFGGDFWAVKLLPAVTGIQPASWESANVSIYPNPTSSGISITFKLTDPSSASIKIFDFAGRTIKTLSNQKLSAGEYNYHWDLTTENNHKAKSGIYMVEIVSDQVSVSKRITVVE